MEYTVPQSNYPNQTYDNSAKTLEEHLTYDTVLYIFELVSEKYRHNTAVSKIYYNRVTYSKCYNDIKKHAQLGKKNICLEIAAKYGRMDMLKLAIRRGANNYNLAFIEACTGGHISVMKYIISISTIPINIINLSFYRACLHKHTKIMDYLLNNYSCNISLGFTGVCLSGNMELVNNMLKTYKINLYSAILTCCKYKKLQQVKYLLEFVDRKDIHKYAPHISLTGDLNLFKKTLSKVLPKNNVLVDWNLCLYKACVSESKKLINYILPHSNDLNMGFRGAVDVGNFRLMKHIIKHDIYKNEIKCFSASLNKARYANNHVMFEYLKNIAKTYGYEYKIGINVDGS